MKELQRRHLQTNNISPERAQRRKGYPEPGSLPSRNPDTREQYQSSEPPSTATSTIVTTPNSEIVRKRPICHLCNEPGHFTDKCPKLSEAAMALKKSKKVHANLAEASPELTEEDEVRPR